MTTDTWHKVGVIVAILALLVAIFSSVAAWLVVPQVQGVLNTNRVASQTPTPTHQTPTPRRQTPTPTPTPNDSYAIRVFNCDDGCRALINGKVVASTGFGKDSGWIDVTDDIGPGSTSITFQVLNNMGAIAYGFQVRKNGSLMFEQICGTAFVRGCEGNRQDFPVGVARDFMVNVGG
jgi:hypothetical protein